MLFINLILVLLWIDTALLSLATKSYKFFFHFLQTSSYIFGKVISGIAIVAWWFDDDGLLSWMVLTCKCEMCIWNYPWLNNEMLRINTEIWMWCVLVIMWCSKSSCYDAKNINYAPSYIEYIECEGLTSFALLYGYWNKDK